MGGAPALHGARPAAARSHKTEAGGWDRAGVGRSGWGSASVGRGPAPAALHAGRGWELAGVLGTNGNRGLPAWRGCRRWLGLDAPVSHLELLLPPGDLSGWGGGFASDRVRSLGHSSGGVLVWKP